MYEVLERTVVVTGKINESVSTINTKSNSVVVSALSLFYTRIVKTLRERVFI